MDLGKRCDFHSHTILSDGYLILSEQLRTVDDMGYECIGVTDHVDSSNIDFVIDSLLKHKKEEAKYYNVRFITGVEITHSPPEIINDLAKHAKKRGVDIVIVHGETLVEPVKKGTNKEAVSSKYVDILAHPGLITEEDVKKANENDVFLELSSRRGHCLSNGHVAKMAQNFGAKLLVNSDAHSSGDFISQEFAFKIAKAAGLDEQKALEVVRDNPKKLLENVKGK